MTMSMSWNESWTAALVNHLWQSTLAAGIAWLLAISLRKYHARIRYWVWFAASVKFLLPFSLLIAAGEWLRSWLPAPAAQPAVAGVVEQLTQPFAPPQVFDATSAPVAARGVNWLPLALLAIWACGALLVAARFARGWWSAYAAKRAARALDLSADVPLLSTPAPIEPGIFGIFQPVLLLPEGIEQRLTKEQFAAVIAHEMCHVRRRDNFTYAIHIIVEALLWFHPLVWWIGARLIDERERACDEAVVQAGGMAEVYAESILRVCKFYIESPLACVSGITGSDLKKRIARIMAGQVAQRLSLSGRMLIGGATLVALTVPVTLGVLHAAEGHAQTNTGNPDASAKVALEAGTSRPRFDAVSIKPDNSGSGYWKNTADGFSTAGMPVVSLVRSAYGLTEEQIVGLPGWARSDRFSIEAKLDPDSAVALEKLPLIQRWKQSQLMMQSLLADRFGLRCHHATQNLPVYEMTIEKGGYKMKKSPLDTGGNFIISNGRIEAHGISMENFALNLSSNVGTMILDETGLAGNYEFDLEWAPEGADPSDPRPSLFTAFKEQLGLKLASTKAPVDVLVIDHVEKPSPN